jgi:hypothetical protein
MYSTVIGYGFAAFLIIFFSYLIYYSSGDRDEPFIETVKIRNIYTVQKISKAALKGLNVVFYLVICLIVLYIVTFGVMTL